jgi:callose synthase
MAGSIINIFFERIILFVYLIISVISCLQIGQACSPLIKRTIIWDSIMELGRTYENMMGLVLFLPIGFLSWFPFVSEFQTRLLFNQAFSRGLQISRILAGQKDIGEFQ